MFKRQLLNKRCLSLPSLAALDNAFSAASEYLNKERKIIIDQLKSLDDPAKKLRLEIELGLSDPKTYSEYVESKVDLKNPVFAEMHYNRFKADVVPKLLKFGHQLKIFENVFPEVIHPTINLEINYENTEWLGAYGHPVPPNWALYSPRFSISTNENKLRYFTLLMMDLDYPNEKKQCYDELCHWLVANIPVDYRLDVDGGSSPFLAPGKGHAYPSAHFIPETPKVSPVIPGETLLDYIPPHPALSDPRKVHRVMFTLLESNTPGEKIDVSRIKSMLNVAEDDTSRPELRLNARSSLGTTYKFINDFDLNIQGYGLITCVWNQYTPDIFTRLKIHEPVYGTLAGQKNEYEILKSLNTARDIASQISVPLSELSHQELHALNTASLSSKFNPILMTKERMEIDSLTGTSIETANKKKKMNRFTVTGVTGLVRSREKIQGQKVY